MIGRIYRGGDIGGLIYYLYGPGKANEHENPHLVAAWDADTPAGLATLEPVILSGQGAHATRAFAPLVTSMELATALREGSINGRMVWHCPLRNDAADRTLTDAEWGEIARDVMHRTGIASRGDAGGCRWIAVRHDDDGIHIAAVLARQDGRAARTDNDFLRVREACQAAEKKYGLTITAPADRTAATHTTRPERERATRTGHAVAAREWLRTEVQHAAAASRDPVEFLDRLRAVGVVVRERRDAQEQLTGYAVGRLEPGHETVLFGGGKLAADLSLPRLKARWEAAGPGPAGAVIVDAQDRRALWGQATHAAGHAAEIVRAQSAGDPDSAGDAALAAAEVLSAASRLVEGEQGGPLGNAARDYDRAARDTFGRTPAGTEAGLLLRAAALAMARASGNSPQSREAAHVALLVAQITTLSLAVARLRQAQGRTAQAQAARRAASELGAATAQWTERADIFVSSRQPMPPAQTNAPPPSQPPAARPAAVGRAPAPPARNTGGRGH